MFSIWLSALSKLVNVIADIGKWPGPSVHNHLKHMVTECLTWWSHCALCDGTSGFTLPHRRHSNTGFQRCLSSPWAAVVIQEAKGDLLPSTSHMASYLRLLLIMVTLSSHSFQMRRESVWANTQCSFPFNWESQDIHCDLHYVLPSPTEITQNRNSILLLFWKSTSRERWSHLSKVTDFTTVESKEQELKYSFTLNSEFQHRCFCLKGWCFSSFMLSSISALLLMYGPNSASVGLAQNSFLWWTIL